MARSTMSLRLDDGLRRRLAAAAGAKGTTVTALVERFVHEGLAMDEHPGIVFRPGPSGRRAGVAGGLDVWELVSDIRRFTGSETERVAALAQELEIHERQVWLALNYAAVHREEIEARVRANDEAFERMERLTEERRLLLA